MREALARRERERLAHATAFLADPSVYRTSTSPGRRWTVSAARADVPCTPSGVARASHRKLDVPSARTSRGGR